MAVHFDDLDQKILPKEAADCNGDGNRNIIDVVGIVGVILNTST